MTRICLVANIDPSKDNMTGHQVFDLAKQVTKENEKDGGYGFSFGPREFSDQWLSHFCVYGDPLCLKMINDK